MGLEANYYRIHVFSHSQVQLLRSCARLIEDDDNGVDLCVFCSDGVCWTSKLILAAASPPVRAALATTPDDTCIILPDVTKAEFFAFHRQESLIKL